MNIYQKLVATAGVALTLATLENKPALAFDLNGTLSGGSYTVFTGIYDLTYPADTSQPPAISLYAISLYAVRVAGENQNPVTFKPDVDGASASYSSGGEIFNLGFSNFKFGSGLNIQLSVTPSHGTLVTSWAADDGGPGTFADFNRATVETVASARSSTPVPEPSLVGGILLSLGFGWLFQKKVASLQKAKAKTLWHDSPE